MLTKEPTMSDGRAGDDEGTDSDVLLSKKNVRFDRSSDTPPPPPPDSTSTAHVSDDVFDSDSMRTNSRNANVSRRKHWIPGVCEIISGSSDDSSSPVVSREPSPQLRNHPLTSQRRRMPKVPNTSITMRPSRLPNNGAHMMHRFRPPAPIRSHRPPPTQSPMAARVRTLHYHNNQQQAVRVVTQPPQPPRNNTNHRVALTGSIHSLPRSPARPHHSPNRRLLPQPTSPRPPRHAQPHVIRVSAGRPSSIAQSLSKDSDDDSDGSYI